MSREEFIAILDAYNAKYSIKYDNYIWLEFLQNDQTIVWIGGKNGDGVAYITPNYDSNSNFIGTTESGVGADALSETDVVHFLGKISEVFHRKK